MAQMSAGNTPAAPSVAALVVAEASRAEAAEAANAAATATNATNIAQAVPRWAPLTTYANGAQVVSPLNDVVSAIAAHTSGAAFTPANWNLSANVLTPTTANNTYAARAGSQIIGNGGESVPGTTVYGMQISEVFPDPNAPIMQHLIGYSFYTGTPGPSAGTLQGGSCQASAYNNGTADMGTILGFEGIGEGNGDNGRKVGPIIGNQGTAYINGNVTADLMIAMHAAGPQRIGGAGAVAEARTLSVQEPTVGTIKRAIYSVGAARFRKGAAANVLEISSDTDLLRWASNGLTLKGLQSDGASTALLFDPTDVPTARIASNLSTGGKHIDCQTLGAPVFAVEASGQLTIAGPSTTTAPAAGGGGALPATPSGYLTLVINGAAQRLPYYPF